MSFLGRIVVPIRIASLWGKALNKASHEKFPDSMACIKSIYSTLGVEIPSEKAPYEINTLCSFVAFKLKKYELSIKSALMVISQLDGEFKSISQHDKVYLKYYCKMLMDRSAYESGLLIPDFDSLRIESEFQKLDRNLVRSHIKSKFPV
jgi:hypothetical protein